MITWTPMKEKILLSAALLTLMVVYALTVGRAVWAGWS